MKIPFWFFYGISFSILYIFYPSWIGTFNFPLRFFAFSGLLVFLGINLYLLYYVTKKSSFNLSFSWFSILKDPYLVFVLILNLLLHIYPLTFPFVGGVDQECHGTYCLFYINIANKMLSIIHLSVYEFIWILILLLLIGRRFLRFKQEWWMIAIL